MRHGRTTDVKHAVDVDVHGLQPLLVGGFFCRGMVDDAGTVDDDIESAENADGFDDDEVAFFARANIAFHESDAAGSTFAGGNDGARTIVVTPVDDDMRTGRGKTARTGLAHARSTAGDQHPFSGEIELQ